MYNNYCASIVCIHYCHEIYSAVHQLHVCYRLSKSVGIAISLVH